MERGFRAEAIARAVAMVLSQGASDSCTERGACRADQRTHRQACVLDAAWCGRNFILPDRRDRTTSRFRIGYVGRLTPEKNVRFLAEIGHALERSAQRESEFYIVGQGSEVEWLKQNVPNAIFPGVLRGEALAQAYANMDLFAFPSMTDTFGNVVLEALASGVPCVVAAEGGPKFLVQSAVTGYVASGPLSFVRCVAGLVNNLDVHHSMREAARHYASGLSWDSVFEKLFRAYESCFDVRHSSGTSSAKRPARVSV